MSKVEARALTTQCSYAGGTELEQLNFMQGRLQILIVGLSGESASRIVFEQALGFRVLDERELQEFWPACSTASGWIFEVTSNGWLQQDHARFGVWTSSDATSKLKEYLITSINECVSVLSQHTPLISVEACRADLQTVAIKTRNP